MDKTSNYVRGGIASFAVDPPDTDYQAGYLAALRFLDKSLSNVDYLAGYSAAVSDVSRYAASAGEGSIA